MSATELITGTTPIPLPRLVERLEPIQATLDAVSPDQRLAWTRSLGNRQLRALFELAEGTQLSVDDFVPKDGSVVIGQGKNGLPVFSWFQKRFARVGDEVVGYNHQWWLWSWFSGPGHFVAYDSPEKPGEVWVDYRTVPKARHAGFPELRPNDRGLISRIVYGGMVDKVRRVSQHVLVGDSFLGTGTPKEKGKGVLFALVLG
jgi:hypothetical protein